MPSGHLVRDSRQTRHHVWRWYRRISLLCRVTTVPISIRFPLARRDDLSQHRDPLGDLHDVALQIEQARQRSGEGFGRTLGLPEHVPGQPIARLIPVLRIRRDSPDRDVVTRQHHHHILWAHECEEGVVLLRQ